jgi:hypothetical protein
MATEWKSPTDAELDAEIEAAAARSAADEPRARSARYDVASGRVEVELRNGCMFAFPAGMAEGLGKATSDQLAQVAVTPSGTGLRWESLDVDLLVAALMGGVFGSRAWMRELARAGGRASTPAKARAARENGRRGGRPRKSGTVYEPRDTGYLVFREPSIEYQAGKPKPKDGGKPEG